MKIAIVGGGAMGLLFTYYLNFQHDVILYVRNPLQRDKIQAEGLLLKHQESVHRTPVIVRLGADWGQGNEDLSIICVKQYHLQELLENSTVPITQRFLFLQNGMGHLKWIDKLGLSNVMVGAVEHGAFRLNENTVIHTGKGFTKIAFYKGRDEEYINALTLPFQESFPFQLEDNYREMLQKKLVVNAVINPLTALLKVRNGVLLENPYFTHMFKALFAEIKGILRLDKEEIYYENLVRICRNTSQNRSSMLKDIEEGRPTEIDAILGYLLEQAEKNKVEAPLVNTLFHFIKGSELEEGGK